MNKLATEEDFVRVKKALDDPKAEFHQFCVRSFGYCSACSALTIYEGNYSLESSSETCSRCKRVFSEKVRSVMGPSKFNWSDDLNYYITYLNIEDMPSECRSRFDQLCSREFQKRVFENKLVARIKDLKAESRKIYKKINKLAKLKR